MYIYKITNNINGKIYIGQTTRSVEERWSNHCSASSKCHAIKNAIDKYGKENFICSILTQCSDKNSLDYWEKYYINLYDSYLNGYNCSYNPGGFFLGQNHSEDSRKKISSTMKRKGLRPKITEEIIEKRRLKLLGKKRSPHSSETKLKISKANSGSNHGMWNRRGKDCPNSGLPILCNNGIIYYSQAEAARELNLAQANIHKVLSKQRNHTGGYTFEYVKEI